jgi:hypothetical protein
MQTQDCRTVGRPQVVPSAPEILGIGFCRPQLHTPNVEVFVPVLKLAAILIGSVGTARLIARLSP